MGCNIVGGGRWISDGVGFYGGGDGFLVMVGCRQGRSHKFLFGGTDLCC